MMRYCSGMDWWATVKLSLLLSEKEPKQKLGGKYINIPLVIGKKYTLKNNFVPSAREAPAHALIKRLISVLGRKFAICYISAA